MSFDDYAKNWGTVSKAASKWSQPKVDALYEKAEKSKWKRASGLPLAIAHTALNTVEVASFLLEPVATFGRGLNHLRKFELLKGFGTLTASVAQAAIVAVLASYFVVASVIRLVALPVFMAIAPKLTCDRMRNKDSSSWGDMIRVSLATVESIATDCGKSAAPAA